MHLFSIYIVWDECCCFFPLVQFFEKIRNEKDKHIKSFLIIMRDIFNDLIITKKIGNNSPNDDALIVLDDKELYNMMFLQTAKIFILE